MAAPPTAPPARTPPPALLAVGTVDPVLDGVLRPLGDLTVCADPRSALLAVHRGARPSVVVAAAARDGAQDVIELVRGLKALLGAGAPPVIVVLDPQDERLLAPVLEAGAADAVLGPPRPADLGARIRARARLPREGPAEPRCLGREAFGAAAAKDLCEQGGWLFGGRALVADLGKGATTRILKAVRLSDGSLAAVKLLDPDVAGNDEDWARRFEREQRILMGIDHPNLVKIRDAGTLEGIPFLDMDFVAGETLDKLIDRVGPLPESRAIEVGAQVARALHALHERKLIHRDVKPENILLDPSGRVRLADFGLSKPHDDKGLTREGEILGTAVFISPEALQGKPPSFASDVYALGVTLFEMITGEDAIDPGSTAEMFQAAVRGRAQQKALLRIPGRLRAVVSRMLAVKPEDRYSNLNNLVSDLEKAHQDSQRLPKP